MIADRGGTSNPPLIGRSSLAKRKEITMKKFTQTANAFVRGANLTRDPTLVALVASATRLPWPLFAIPAGVIIDRRDRKRMMVQADVFSLVLTCGVIGLILSRSPLSAEGDPSAYVLALLGSAGVIRDKSCREGGYGPR
jgi:MFS family permease